MSNMKKSPMPDADKHILDTLHKELEVHDWYVDWANTLDSAGVDSTDARGRLMRRRTIDLMNDTMPIAINASRHIDALKKHIFYGRDRSALESYDVNSMLVVPGVADRMDDHNTVRLIHAVFGLYDEAGELMQALYEYIFFDKPLDPVNLKEEFGDSLWYMAVAARYFNERDFAFFMMGNYAKLTARYPEATWSQDRALNRDLDSEHKALSYQNVDIQDTQYNTITKIVEQLRSCNYETVDGHHILEMNAAFKALEAMAEREGHAGGES